VAGEGNEEMVMGGDGGESDGHGGHGRRVASS
jgi:hypothetical protein